METPDQARQAALGPTPCGRGIFTALLFYLFCIGLLLFGSVTFIRNWVRIGSGDDETILSVMRCVECPNDKEWWSYECFSQDYDEMDYDRAAEVFQKSDLAGKAFIAMELLALLFTIMLEERLLYYICKADYGSPYVIYVLPGLIGLFHFLGMVSWFGETGANWSNDCDELPSDDSDEPEFCAADGPIVILFQLFFILAFIGLFTWAFCKRDTNYDAGNHGIESGSFLCFGTRTWLIIVAFLLFANLVVIIGAWTTPKWVERNADDISFEGGLFHCKDCHVHWTQTITSEADPSAKLEVTYFMNKHEIEWFGWDCMQGEHPCDDEESDIGYCDLVDNLWVAGMVYTMLQMMAVFAILQVLNVVLHGICGRQFGFPILHYIVTLFMVLFQILAIGMWFRISNGRTDGDCEGEIDLSGDESPLVCVTDGPALLIFESIFMCFTASLFIIVYCKRGSDGDNGEGPSESELQGFEQSPEPNYD